MRVSFSLRKMFCSTARFRFGEKMATQLTWYGQSGYKVITPERENILDRPLADESRLR